ncbi:hypothetical protein P4S64_17930 [Vibrio sp. M60_M31a]
MSRTIVEGFGGSLDVEPSDRRGLTFCCSLPLRSNKDRSGRTVVPAATLVRSMTCRVNRLYMWLMMIRECSIPRFGCLNR